jgi:hypothetical protein
MGRVFIHRRALEYHSADEIVRSDQDDSGGFLLVTQTKDVYEETDSISCGPISASKV